MHGTGRGDGIISWVRSRVTMRISFRVGGEVNIRARVRARVGVRSGLGSGPGLELISGSEEASGSGLELRVALGVGRD